MEGNDAWRNLRDAVVAFLMMIPMFLVGLSLMPSRTADAVTMPATTEPPDPSVLVITADVGADEHSFNLEIATVVVADGVTAIGDRAFRDCMALRRIHLPASLETIGQAAFSGCDGLQIIVYGGTAAQWEAIPKGRYWAAGVPAKEVICSDGREALVLN